MYNFLEPIKNIDNLIQKYNINSKIFLLIYFSSIIPVYLGYFLIIYGSSKGISLKDILRIKLNKLKINKIVVAGIIINIFGLSMPYLYILFWGRHLPLLFYFIILLIASFLIFYFLLKIRKGFNDKTLILDGLIKVIKKETIGEQSDKEKLWEIYNYSFIELNKKTPCRQSFDKDHFFIVLENPTAIKYIVYSKNDNKIIGLGIITDDFKNTPWISEEYFKNKFNDLYNKKNIFYFMGVAINEDWRGKGCATFLIKKITENLPRGAIIGFDSSRNINYFIPNFTNIIAKNRKVKNKYLDSQNYYIVSV